ncbi:PNK3P-domain-containing protein [Gigaspora margarita]|uniref:PNK3P-domain-containing protein n=1 Tax=Gigaspora margarita TaxID=4874 RepID=A0A8H4EP51_GIGMA|nr:PNK3P-domain-containing protein [Gigaspora margarita]
MYSNIMHIKVEAETIKTVSGTKRKRHRSNSVEEVDAVLKKEAKIVESTSRVFSKNVIRWTLHNSLLIGQYIKKGDNFESRANIAAFDLDDTLITTKGVHRFPKDANDWKWLNKKVPERLTKLYEEGYKIIMISNQAGLSPGKKTGDKKRTDFKNKIGQIADSLNISFEIYAAMAYDKYRKPMIGIWNYFVENRNVGVTVDKENSFYVGDAAGRIKNWKLGVSSDWTDTDRKFAENIGINFYTPEEFFDNVEVASFSYKGFDPKKLPRDVPLFIPSSSSQLALPAGQCEMVIFVGYPASGKSTFAKKWLVNAGYVHVNQDTLKTKQKCIRACETALKENKSVVIDNTNPSKESRKQYIDIAKQCGVPVRCFWFKASEALARHNNMYRHFNSENEIQPLPDIAFNVYNSKFFEPKLEEGFQEVIHINFIFEGNDHERKIFNLWYS